LQGGQRGAQLVGGSGQKIGLRRGLLAEPGQQLVERFGQLLHFVAGGGHGQRRNILGLLNAAGLRGHAPQRPQHHARH
jgi:hypothetical protein